MGTGRRPRGSTTIRIRDRTLRSLKSIDDMLGAVRHRLEETGEENTIIVFTSDNGMQWGDHGLAGKTTPYIPSVRVLLYVSWPGHIAPAVVAPTWWRSWTFPRPCSTWRAFLPPRCSTVAASSGTHARSFCSSSTAGPASACRRGRRSSRRRSSTSSTTASTGPTTHEAYDMVDDRRQLRNLYRDGVPGNEPPAGSHRRLRRLATCEGACP